MPSPSSWRLPALIAMLIGLIALNTFLTTIRVEAADENLNEGVKLYGQKSYKLAINHLKRVNGSGDKPTALYYEALCLQGLGDSTASIRLLRKIKATYPTSREGQTVTAYFLNAQPATPMPSTPARPTSGLGLSTAASGGGDSLPDNCTVPFHRGQGGHMFVNVLINGRPVEVIFDTGASTCLFGKQQLNNAGVSYTPTGSSQVRGIGADTLTCDQANLRVSLGEITKTINTAIMPGKMTTASLLGQDFFNEFRYDIDTATGVIHLRKKGVRSIEALDTINIPFKVSGREMLVDARVNGRQCVMIFDTGSFNNLFTAATWSQLGLSIPADARMVSAGGVGGSSRGFLFKTDKIELGGVMKVNPEVVVLESGPPFPLLGQEFLKDKRFSIDNDNHVIRFVH